MNRRKSSAVDDFFLTLIGNIMMIHLSLTGPKTPLKQTSEMWGKQLHRA